MFVEWRLEVRTPGSSSRSLEESPGEAGGTRALSRPRHIQPQLPGRCAVGTRQAQFCLASARRLSTRSTLSHSGHELVNVMAHHSGRMSLLTAGTGVTTSSNPLDNPSYSTVDLTIKVFSKEISNFLKYYLFKRMLFLKNLRTSQGLLKFAFPNIKIQCRSTVFTQMSKGYIDLYIFQTIF